MPEGNLDEFQRKLTIKLNTIAMFVVYKVPIDMVISRYLRDKLLSSKIREMKKNIIIVIFFRIRFFHKSKPKSYISRECFIH